MPTEDDIEKALDRQWRWIGPCLILASFAFITAIVFAFLDWLGPRGIQVAVSVFVAFHLMRGYQAVFRRTDTHG